MSGQGGGDNDPKDKNTVEWNPEYMQRVLERIALYMCSINETLFMIVECLAELRGRMRDGIPRC